MAKRLTAKQQRFVDEYLIDLNATQAAARAGYKDPNIGRQLITKDNVSAKINARRAALSEKLEITQEWVLGRLAAIAGADVTDFLSVTTEPAAKLGIHPLTGEVINVPGGYQQTVRITDTDKIPAGKTAALASIKQGANGIELKLHDKVRALELLGKHLGLFDSVAAAPPTCVINLFDAIVGAAEKDIETDDLPEIEQEVATQILKNTKLEE